MFWPKEVSAQLSLWFQVPSLYRRNQPKPGGLGSLGLFLSTFIFAKAAQTMKRGRRLPDTGLAVEACLVFLTVFD